MRLAILGTRGVPANYGGFETLAEELGSRLVRRGHEVTVYGRKQWIDFRGTHYKGMRVRLLPTLTHKYLDTLFHTFISALHAVFQPYDAVLVCNGANAVFCAILRLCGKKVALNVDGLERKRKKWNAFGKAWYRLNEPLSTRLPNRMITDALVIQRYYLERYNARSTFIAYGADGVRAETRDTLERLGLEGEDYVLYVSRLEPENNAHVVIKAFEKVKTGHKLLVVGHAPYADEYIAELRKTADPRIVFTGGIYGPGYRELQSNAAAYIHATEVGGCHPALIEAMAFGNCVIVNDTPENIETIGDAGVVYKLNDPDDLAEKLQSILDNPGLAGHCRSLAAKRARAVFGWESIVTQYENLFKEMTGAK